MEVQNQVERFNQYMWVDMLYYGSTATATVRVISIYSIRQNEWGRPSQEPSHSIVSNVDSISLWSSFYMIPVFQLNLYLWKYLKDTT